MSPLLSLFVVAASSAAAARAGDAAVALQQASADADLEASNPRGVGQDVGNLYDNPDARHADGKPQWQDDWAEHNDRVELSPPDRWEPGGVEYECKEQNGCKRYYGE